MALNIKDSVTDKAVRRLAALTGEGVTTAIRISVEERIQRITNRDDRANLAEKLLEIGAHCASLPELDARTAEEILGYDEDGLPR